MGGVALSEKSGTAVTFNVKVVVRLTKPAVPVSVTGHAPRAADALALMVKVVLQVGEQPPGLKDAVTPVGSPDTPKVAF